MTELLTILNQHSWLFITLGFLFGSVIGSFLNVVIHRLPVMMKREWQQECLQFLKEYLQEYHPALVSKLGVAKLGADELAKPIDGYPQQYNLLLPRSACPKCHTQIKSWHNLPILGWLMLRGKCASCAAPISARYPIIELLTALAISTLAWHFGPSWEFLLTSALTFTLIALTGIDLDEMLLPDQLTLPLLWLGLLVNLGNTFASPTDAIIGAAAGYLSLWSIFWLFKLLTGKEGMGYGDFKLLAVFGAWLGWQMLPLIILLSSLVGAVVGIGLIMTKRLHKGNPIPFGPYIAAAGWLALIWGQEIVGWYLKSL